MPTWCTPCWPWTPPGARRAASCPASAAIVAWATPTGEGRMKIRLSVLVLFVIVTAAVAAGVAALLVNIYERKQEAKNPFLRVVELAEDTEDPAVWGKNFRSEYDQYRKTVDQVRTRYGGSEAVP